MNALARRRISCLVFAQIIMMTIPLVSSSSQRNCGGAAFVPSASTTFPTLSCQYQQRAHTHHYYAKRNNNFQLMAIDPMQQVAVSSDLQAVGDAQQSIDNLQIEQLSPETTIIVFIIGIIPFIWATYEFWRRIAVGATFGTGKDSVVIPSPFSDKDDENDLIMIGEDNNPNSSRGRQTLDRGALTVAYILFAIAGGSIAIAVASVVMGPQPNPL